MADDATILQPRPVAAPPVFVAGTPVEASKLNTLARATADLAGGVRAPRFVEGSGDVDPRIYTMVVLAEEGDFLLCQPTGKASIEAVRVSSGAGVRVAKPYLLRRSPFHGKVRAGQTLAHTAVNERTATDAAGRYEEQVIVPSYEPGDVIYATRAAGPTYITPQAQDPVAVEWLDLNLDGRAWATA